MKDKGRRIRSGWGESSAHDASVAPMGGERKEGVDTVQFRGSWLGQQSLSSKACLLEEPYAGQE
jgi:hypothetical protein